MTKINVLPSEPVCSRTIKLSVTDCYAPKVWGMQSCFWPVDEDFEQAFIVLKEGLSRTISEIPTLGGRVGRVSGNPRDLTIEIDEKCSVDIEYEDVTAYEGMPDYETLRKAAFPMTKLNFAFAPKTMLVPVSEGAPILVIKLNRMVGGFNLSFGANHLLFDAGTVTEFFRIWASHCVDVSNGGVKRTYKDFHGEDAVRVRLSTPTQVEEFENENWTIFPTELSQLNLPKQVTGPDAALAMLNKAKEEYLKGLGLEVEVPKWVVWKFSPESLAQLKKDASGTRKEEWISTIDALAGLFWARIASIKKVEGDEDAPEESKLIFPVNLRGRMSPPINPRYLGNAIDTVFATCPLADLEAGGRSAIQAAALSVRRATNGWSQSTWEGWLAAACHLPDDQALCPNPLSLLERRNFIFNDYSSWGCNTIDWGRDLGKMECLRHMKPPGSLTGCANMVIANPRLSDGNLETLAIMEDSVRIALEKDEVFMKYATLCGWYD